MGQPTTNRSEAYGPYEIVSLIGPDVLPFLTVPYADVMESSVLVSITGDNAAQAIRQTLQPSSQSIYCVVHAEIAVFGSIQGFQCLLKRQAVKANWGPMVIRFTGEDAYDQIIFAGRLFVGGKPGFPANIVLSTPLTVPAMVHIRPRRK